MQIYTLAGNLTLKHASTEQYSYGGGRCRVKVVCCAAESSFPRHLQVDVTGQAIRVRLSPLNWQFTRPKEDRRAAGRQVDEQISRCAMRENRRGACVRYGQSREQMGNEEQKRKKKKTCIRKEKKRT
ncbi:hypothetical protein E2C01_070721 [Portunus trituberculatus]|uniref:Uncharacterized protein n=1 Tax=Portunus trituberculatus TaxID=210409 RepID=A0A5B7HTG4_PORTR|nr:hypothetical protein [Portunus trituberculatus]